MLNEQIHEGIQFPGRPQCHMESGHQGVNGRENQNGNGDKPGTCIVDVNICALIGLPASLAPSPMFRARKRSP